MAAAEAAAGKEAGGKKEGKGKEKKGANAQAPNTGDVKRVGATEWHVLLRVLEVTGLPPPYSYTPSISHDTAYHLKQDLGDDALLPLFPKELYGTPHFAFRYPKDVPPPSLQSEGACIVHG